MTTITLNQAQSTANTSNLEQFFQAVLSNQELQNKLKIATDLESLSQMALEFGQKYGYYFTIEELQAATAVEAAIGNLWRTLDDSRMRSIDFDVPSAGGSYSTCSNCIGLD
ncbi:MAG: Nif11-like leader peptide family natural product precursor [Scytonematopsis contorta HA4267-MV1]|jgi:predicted component of type VI protein secretion system|nr:Nif11-like leader peptide family natural product precursor [Scytonematopsis contorta HA4267-MV1]